MRMSCNGCRVLRKGCSEDCSIRPCLQWIKNPESQAHATVFLAKFYGRAGLMNLINAGPEHLRPAIFRSLLYEACGRIVNPIYGSVGLLWSGSWQMCQAAVEAVLKGAPIVQIPSETAANTPTPPLKAYDIRHVSKDDGNNNAGGSGSSSAAVGPHDLHKVNKATRTRFKRPGSSSGNSKQPKPSQACGSGGADDDGHRDLATDPQVCNLRWRRCYPVDCQSAPSHESSGSHQDDSGVGVPPDDGGGSAGAAGAASAAAPGGGGDGESRELNESMFSAETPDASMVTSHGELWRCESGGGETGNGGSDNDGEVELELTLGFEPPVPQPHSRSNTSSPRRSETAETKRRRREKAASKPPLDGLGSDTCEVDLALDLAC